MDTVTMASEERPLITFALIAYNQERFIREAVEGALAQSYDPLEILLSDDCSPDGTFEIMKEMVTAYSGPHKIVLTRNDENLGIGAHINRIMTLSHGELIVIAAGDDISLPHRTSEIHQAWLDSDKKAFSLHSQHESIDEEGNTIARLGKKYLPTEQQLLFFSKTLASRVCGATHAWHRKVFDTFGPLPLITLEDIAIPPRSMLLGSVVYIKKPLVKYRTHANNIWISSNKLSTREAIDKDVYYLNDRITICDDVTRCIYEYKSTINDFSQKQYLDECISTIANSRCKCIYKVKSLTGNPAVKSYYLLKYLLSYGLQRNDFFWMVCAISITTASLSLYFKKNIMALLKIDFGRKQTIRRIYRRAFENR